MTKRKKIEKELGRLKTKVEAAWLEHDKIPIPTDFFCCPGVGSVGTCTNTAVYLAERLGGDVYGYLIEDNPTALAGRDEGGHDFLIVDDRYLVDFWAMDTYQYPALYDMEDPLELSEVRKMYGDSEKWTRMSNINLRRYKKELKSR